MTTALPPPPSFLPPPLLHRCLSPGPAMAGTLRGDLQAPAAKATQRSSVHLCESARSSENDLQSPVTETHLEGGSEEEGGKEAAVQ